MCFFERAIPACLTDQVSSEPERPASEANQADRLGWSWLSAVGDAMRQMILALVLLLGAAACGGGEDGGTKETPTVRVTTPATATASPTPTRTLTPTLTAQAPAPPPAQKDVYYANCDAARAAGAAPLSRGEPGYRAGLDRDNDGVACE